MNGTSHLSYSSLSAFKESPKTFIDYKLNKREATDAMLYGSMVHCLVLQPKEFDKRYFTFDDSLKIEEIGGSKPRATKQYKEWYTKETSLAGDREIVSPSDFKHAQIVSNNVRFNRASRFILDQCEFRETKIEWEYMNFKFLGFIDAHGKKIIMDLKTMPDAQQDKASRTILNEDYYLQAAMYIAGKNFMDKTDIDYDYYIIAVDKIGGTSVHKLHKNLINHGMELYHKLLVKFNECVLKDKWDYSFDFWSDQFHGFFHCEKPSWMY